MKNTAVRRPTMESYHKDLQQMFAKYGFVSCPLTDEQIADLYEREVELDQAYNIGCDINCGFSYDECTYHAQIK
jgi:hypothetical protein